MYAIIYTYARVILVLITEAKIYSLNMFFGDNVDAISSTYALRFIAIA